MAADSRLRFRGIRPRATIAAALTVGVAMAVGGLGLIALLNSQLLLSLDSMLTTQASDRAALVAGGADPTSLLGVEQREAFVMISVDGSILVSDGVEDIRFCQSVDPCSTTAVFLEDSEERDVQEVRLVSAEADPTSPSDPGTVQSTVIVHIGAELEEVTSTVRRVRSTMLFGIPALVALVGWLTWTIVGKALRPVEKIRLEAEAITASALDRRVTEPNTGDEIDRLASTINDMLARLAADAQAQRRFASDASHELKSPLANLRTMIDTADVDGASWDALQRATAGEIDRMASLVDDLLFLAASDERLGSAAAFHRVHLDDVIFDEVERLTPAVGVRLDPSGVEPVQVRGDVHMLQRLVRNLLENSARYARSTVVISMTVADGISVVTIDDDGPGIPEAERESIFERFTRLDPSRDRASGNAGLGLAIARTIAAIHDGSLDVTGAPIGGARFTFTLPAV